MQPTQTGETAAERVQASVAQLEGQRLGTELESISRRTRKRPLVLYFGRSTFADNTKYLYLRDVARERGHEVVWCSLDPDAIRSLQAAGLPHLDLSADMDRSIDLLLHAAVAVFCVNPAESLKGSFSLNGCLAGAKKLQLWHGVSVKHLLLRLIPHLGLRDAAIRRAFYMASQADVVLSTASTFDAFWSECFGCRDLVRAGLPRNEVLLRPAEPAELIGSEVSPQIEEALSSGRRNVLLVPTWQRGALTYLNDQGFYRSLLAIAERQKLNVFLKMHPMYAHAQNDTRQRAKLLFQLGAGLDLYPLMHRFDLLLTDYSSIMFDFLLTGRPVMALDLDDSPHHQFEPDMSLVPDVPFRHTFTPRDLEATLRTALLDDHLGPRREEMASRIFESDPRLASEHLLAVVDALLHEALDDDVTVRLP